MTRYNFTFQEASPLISYSDQWVEGATADPDFAKYNGSFRVTSSANSTASFTFTGTGISLFGSERANHGNYTVKLDQEPLFTAPGSTGKSPQKFNTSLWHANDLEYAQHTVTLTNVPIGSQNLFLDLDFISIERQIGNDGDNIFQTAFDDTSPAVTYSGTWEQTQAVSTAYLETLHTSTSADSQVAVTFRGCCVEIYGQYANAQYSVALDNLSPINMSGMDVDLISDLIHPQTLLYMVDGLTENVNHTITLTNTNSNTKRPFSFDYAVVSSAQNITADGTPPPSTVNPGTAAPAKNAKGQVSGAPSHPPAQSPLPAQSSLPAPSQPSASSVSVASSANVTVMPVGAIVAASVGATVVILVLLVVGYFLMRRGGRKHAQRVFQELVRSEPKPYQFDPESQRRIPGRAQEYLFKGGANALGQSSSTGTGAIVNAAPAAPTRSRDRKGGPPTSVTPNAPVQEEDAGATLPPSYIYQWVSREKQ